MSGRLRREVKKNLGGISGALGISAGALLAFDETATMGVVVSLIAVGVFILHVINQVRRRRTFEKEIAQLSNDIQGAANIRSVLMGLSDRLLLPSPWRISIYEVRGSKWHLLTRRSTVPEYETSGRAEFGTDQGCIGWALKSRHLTDELPALPDPKRDADGYVDQHASRRVPFADVSKFHMPSRSYAAMVFHISNGIYQGTAVGVVAECETPQGVSLTAMQRELHMEVVTMLHQLAKIAPDARRLNTLVAEDG